MQGREGEEKERGEDRSLSTSTHQVALWKLHKLRSATWFLYTRIFFLIYHPLTRLATTTRSSLIQTTMQLRQALVFASLLAGSAVAVLTSKEVKDGIDDITKQSGDLQDPVEKLSPFNIITVGGSPRPVH